MLTAERRRLGRAVALGGLVVIGMVDAARYLALASASNTAQ
jgi:hypothetical protein